MKPRSSVFSDPLLIFDCDGVLIDSEVIYLEVELAFLRSKGIDVERSWYVREFLALAQDIAWQRLIDLSLERTGRPLGDDDRKVMKTQARERVIAEVEPIAGAHDLLDALTARRCVASSTQLPFLHRKLEKTGLARHFGDGVYSGDMVENGKPAPDLFLHAARDMGHDGACIVIEDSANGVRGGKAAGHFVVGFTGGSHCLDGHDALLEEAGADILLSGHADLGAWLSENTNAV